MILSGHTIRRELIMEPHLPRTEVKLDRGYTASFGESFAGYDIRLGHNTRVWAGEMSLGASLERFTMPNDVLGIVHDKSTWARRGLTVQNTVIEPGWQGWLTLEMLFTPLASRPDEEWNQIRIELEAGWPIAQIVFHRIDRATSGYEGKYQDQGPNPQEAL